MTDVDRHQQICETSAVEIENMMDTHTKKKGRMAFAEPENLNNAVPSPSSSSSCNNHRMTATTRRVAENSITHKQQDEMIMAQHPPCHRDDHAANHKHQHKHKHKHKHQHHPLVFFQSCCKTFLPSMTPKFTPATLMMEDAPKQQSIRFQLDQNTVHILPEELPSSKRDRKKYLFITAEEQEATILDMNVTVTYFRRLFWLEGRPKRADLASSAWWMDPAEQSTTIGLEWRIWDDGRFERRRAMEHVVRQNRDSSNNSSSNNNKKKKKKNYPHPALARKCHAISTISEHLARERAQYVINDLLEEEEEEKEEEPSLPPQNTKGPAPGTPGRWLDFHSLVERIPRLRQT